MLNYMKEKSVMNSPDLDIAKAKAEGKEYILGVLQHDTERGEFCQMYEDMASQGGREKK